MLAKCWVAVLNGLIVLPATPPRSLQRRPTSPVPSRPEATTAAAAALLWLFHQRKQAVCDTTKLGEFAENLPKCWTKAWYNKKKIRDELVNTFGMRHAL